MSKNKNLPKTSQIDGIDGISQIGEIDGIDGIDGIGWSDLTNRDRSLISMDCEPNFTRAMIDRMSLTLSEEQIMQIEEGFRVADPEIVKDALYDHLVNCIFDDVHIDRVTV